MDSKLPQLGRCTPQHLPFSYPRTKRTVKLADRINRLPPYHLRCHPEFRARATGDAADQADGQITEVAKSQGVAISNSPDAKNDTQSSANSPKLLAVAAVAVGVIAFGASRFGSGGVSLAQVASTSTPLDEALSNGRPTVVEFYANYCEVCRELAPTTYAVGEAYRDRVNFVMLNVDNMKWAPEVAEYGVRGIPHFVFLDNRGKVQAAAVGKVPWEVLERDVEALAEGSELPYRGIARQTSALRPAGGAMPGPSAQTMPRDHS